MVSRQGTICSPSNVVGNGTVGFGLVCSFVKAQALCAPLKSLTAPYKFLGNTPHQRSKSQTKTDVPFNSFQSVFFRQSVQKDRGVYRKHDLVVVTAVEESHGGQRQSHKQYFAKHFHFIMVRSLSVCPFSLLNVTRVPGKGKGGGCK